MNQKDCVGVKSQQSVFTTNCVCTLHCFALCMIKSKLRNAPWLAFPYSMPIFIRYGMNIISIRNDLSLPNSPSIQSCYNYEAWLNVIPISQMLSVNLPLYSIVFILVLYPIKCGVGYYALCACGGVVTVM